MDDKDDIDDEDDDKPNLRSNMSGPSSLDRRVGSATQVAHLRPSEMGSKGLLFSFVFSPSTLLSGSQFSTSAGRHASLFDDQDEDMSTPTPLPPPPTVKTDPQGQGQGQQKEEETVKDLEMQIEKLQARLEEKKMLEKKEQLSSSMNNSVKGQSSDKEYEKLSKIERSNSNDWGEEWKMQTGNAEDSGDIVTENNVHVPSKPADKKEVPISKLLKKDSFNKTKFNQEDFLNSLLSSPPTSTKRVLKGEGTGAWRMPPDAKKHGGGISNKEMHQRSKHMADEGIKDCSTAGGFEEGIGRNLDSGWESIEEGVFENQFFDYKIPQDVVEISLPANPNIPHTRSRRVEGYEYTEQNVFNSDSAPPSDSKSNLVNSFQNENTPGKTFSVNDNFPDSRNHSMEYSDLPPLKYPDHSPITSPPTTGDGKNPSSPNISNVESGHNTQLPPKRKSQEVTAPSGDSSFVPELDEEDISGYHEFNTSNRTSYSKAPGTSPHHSMSRYSSYMSSLQSLSDHFGYVIKDVTPDGNCMFSAIIDQLRIQGNFDLTPNSLRKTAVEYLRNNPKNQDGTHLESFLSTETWEEYLSRMGQESQWGDHMVLQACTEVTGQKIVVFKPNTNKTVLVPTAEEPDENQSLTLGHIGESHFVSLRPKDWETNWPLMAHAHRAKTKEKQKLARKKRREMKKSKKQKMTLDTTVSNKEEPTTTDEKGKEKESEKGKEMESDKEEQKESEKGKEKENEDGKETWGEEGKKTGSGAELRETEGATKAVVETGSGAEVPETEGATKAAVAETGSGAEVPETESATKAAVAETGSGAEVLETEGATKAAVAETVSGAKVPETEGATKAAVTENEPDEDEDDEDDEEEAESDDSQFKTTDDVIGFLHDPRSIDKESKVPILHLEYLLRSQLPPCSGLQGGIYMHATDSVSGGAIEYLGSCTEQLRVFIRHAQVGKTCCAEMSSTKVTYASISEGNHVRQREEKLQSVYDLRAESVDCPGYLRLKPIIPRMWRPAALSTSPDGKAYLSHPFGKDSHKVRDLVGVRCSQWPLLALEWKSRHRPSNWPGEQVIRSTVEEGCLIISRAHPDSNFPNVEWQYVFPCAERILALDALTDDMRNCFWVFKSLVDYYLIKAPARLKTTHLKTVMYFACETISVDTWKVNKAGCLIYLLHMLLRYLASKRLPNYFITGNNMLDGFTDEQLAFFTTTIQVVRSFPINAIAFMLDHYGSRCLDTIHCLIDDIKDFRRNLSINKTVQAVFVPEILLHVRLYIIYQSYDHAAHLLHSAYFFIETANNDLPSNDRTVITYQDFVVQTLKGERQEDIQNMYAYLDKLFGTNFEDFYKIEIPAEVHQDTAITRVEYQKDAKDTSLQGNGSSKHHEEPVNEGASATSGELQLEDVACKEKHPFREPQYRLKDLLGTDKAGKSADKLLPPRTMDSIVLQSKFLLEFVSDLHKRNQHEECAHIATCAIDLIKRNQADQLDASSIEDPVLRGEVEKHHLDTDSRLKSYLIEFYSMLIVCQNILGSYLITQKQLEDFREAASGNPIILKMLDDIMSQQNDNQL